MDSASAPQERLKRNLNVWEAIALSLAIMAPSMAANINPQASAAVVGRAVPLSFLIATLGALLIAHSFVRLSQRYHHAGSVYGFVGATLGEETRDPKRDVPRAIWGTVLFGGAYYVVVTAVEVMGFGTRPDEIKAFVNSSSLMGELSSQYVAPWLGHIITLGATVSAISCALACVVGASRLIYALSRDGAGLRSLDFISQSHGIPSRSVALVVFAGWAFFIVAGNSKLDVFNAAAIVGGAGALLLLIAYFMACLGGLRLFFKGAKGGVAISKWEVFAPLAAMVVLAYTMARNIWPLPHGAALLTPAIFLLVALIVAVAVLVRPEAMRLAGARLTKEEIVAAGGEDASA